MKLVSAGEVDTTKFSHSLFLLKIWEDLLSIENCNESGKSLSQQLLFEVSLFRFHFVSALQCLDYCYKEYQVKQTASLSLKLAFETCIF